MPSSPEPPAISFAFLDARLRAAVEEAVKGDPNPADPLRGLYISDEQALALAGGSGAAGIDGRLADAATRLGLDALDTAVAGVCAAPELDPRYGRLYAYLHDDVTRRLASPRLCGELLAGDGVTAADVLGCFGPAGRLVRAGAVRVLPGDGTQALADRAVKLADRLAAFLLGAGAGFGDPPSTLRRYDAPEDGAGRAGSVQEVARLLGTPSRLPLVVCGPDAAAVLASAAGRGLLIADVRELEKPEATADAALAAALEGRVLCFDGLGGVDPAERARVVHAIGAHHARVLLVSGSRREALALSEETVLLVEVPMPGFPEREAAWRRFAGAADPREVAAKFRLSIEQVRDAAEVARIVATARGAETPEPEDLDAGARHASSTRLGELAQRLPPGFRWGDLVLPDRQLELLQGISAYLRHRDQVLSDWGYERTVARTQGLKVLFAGESGTGKTMAAQVLAAGLGLEIFRVDLATVVSKYIGETEKNLERIFGAADGSNAILFFDEADALFGKRSEVSDSHDRYANIEVAYLLQRMEAYPGAVILATNFKRNIDDAFVRRLDFVIDFPFPEAEDRRRIWQLVLPAEAPVHADVDLDFLATQFKLSGGAIRNCSLAAAFQAADEGCEIEMRHLVRGVAQEYGKQGRLTLEADFDRFHELIRGNGRGD
ncbi:MAG TPA: ATP-binding protein [Solirubrobacteraceae bacterium]|nr:ATP-binding protein [Solirubrobacteraceae bacterium]